MTRHFWGLTPGLIALTLVVPGVAHAATYIVNSINEPGDGTCDASECTLREAVDSLSADGDLITFDFSLGTASPPFEIELDNGLVIGQDEITLDGLQCTGCGAVQGTTTSAADGFNSQLAIRIIASTGFTGSSLIFIDADDVTIRGLNLDGSPQWGM